MPGEKEFGVRSPEPGVPSVVLRTPSSEALLDGGGLENGIDDLAELIAAQQALILD